MRGIQVFHKYPLSIHARDMVSEPVTWSAAASSSSTSSCYFICILATHQRSPQQLISISRNSQPSRSKEKHCRQLYSLQQISGPPAMIKTPSPTLYVMVDCLFQTFWRFFQNFWLPRGRFFVYFSGFLKYCTSFHLHRPVSWILIRFG